MQYAYSVQYTLVYIFYFVFFIFFSHSTASYVLVPLDHTQNVELSLYERVRR